MAVKEKTGDFDVIIIGAGLHYHQPQSTEILNDTDLNLGLYGIQAARYYLDIHPEAKLCILESDDVVGGTWSSSMHHYLYSGLSTLQTSPF